jgi:hypothetical protein
MALSHSEKLRLAREYGHAAKDAELHGQHARAALLYRQAILILEEDSSDSDDAEGSRGSGGSPQCDS